MPVSYAQMACKWLIESSTKDSSTRDHGRPMKLNQDNRGDWMPSRKLQHTLLSGFVGHGAPRIPHDLISLMLLFYDETTYWKLTNAKLREFKSRRNGQVMYGPDFSLNGIDFVTTLCPFGWKPQQSGSVQFYIELRALPAAISSITVYYELWCAQTQSHCKKLRTFRRASDAQSWGTNNMRFAECADHDTLEFASLVKVLRVIPAVAKQPTVPGSPGRPRFDRDLPHIRIRMAARTRFTWRISGAQVAQMTACQEGKFWYSPSFGSKCFCLELAPNGWHHSNRGTLMLYLRLLALPHRVGRVECECRFGGIADMLPAQTQTHAFCYERHGLQWGATEVARSEKLRTRCGRGLDITISIEVLRVRAVDGTELPRAVWAEYGVI